MLYFSVWASQVVLVVKNPPAHAKDLTDAGSIPALGRSAGAHDNPLQYSCLENPLDRGAWQAAVHGFARVRHSFATKTKTTSNGSPEELLSTAWVRTQVVP